MCWNLSKTNRKAFTTKRNDLKGIKLSNEKGISGRRQFTDKGMNILQSYEGMGMRQNTNDITEMRNFIFATLYHCNNFWYEEPRHLFFSKGENSWCKWQSDAATGNKHSKKKSNLPVDIMNEIKPVFQQYLPDVKMLEYCLRGMTQNCN